MDEGVTPVVLSMGPEPEVSSIHPGFLTSEFSTLHPSRPWMENLSTPNDPDAPLWLPCAGTDFEYYIHESLGTGSDDTVIYAGRLRLDRRPAEPGHVPSV